MCPTTVLLVVITFHFARNLHFRMKMFHISTCQACTNVHVTKTNHLQRLEAAGATAKETLRDLRVRYPSASGSGGGRAACMCMCVVVVNLDLVRHLFTNGQTRAKVWMKLLAFLYWRGGASHTRRGWRGRGGQQLAARREGVWTVIGRWVLLKRPLVRPKKW